MEEMLSRTAAVDNSYLNIIIYLYKKTNKF